MIVDARVLLVRHGEPADTDRCHGARSDPALSDVGRRQAAAAALRLRALVQELGGADRALTSPAARAIDTSAPLVAALDVARTIDERWRERDFGAWEGRPWRELWPTVDESVRSDAAAYAAWSPPEAETPEAVLGRVAPALDDALTGAGLTVVVTHAGAIRAALSVGLGLDGPTALRVSVPYARAVVLARTEDVITLERVGA